MRDLTTPYDRERAAALWPVKGEGEHVARCLYQAMREHAQHLPCEKFMCVQDRTLELAYEAPEDDGMGGAGVWWAAASNSLIPLIKDFRAQVREARATETAKETNA